MEKRPLGGSDVYVGFRWTGYGGLSTEHETFEGELDGSASMESQASWDGTQIDVGDPTADDRGCETAAGRDAVLSFEWDARGKVSMAEALSLACSRTRVERFDLVRVRNVPTPADEVLLAMDELIRAGKLRAGGSVTLGTWGVAEAHRRSHELGVVGFCFEQGPLSLFDRRAQSQLIPLCQALGIAFVATDPLAGGRLHEREAFDDGHWTESNDPVRRKVVEIVKLLDRCDEWFLVSQVAATWAYSQRGIDGIFEPHGLLCEQPAMAFGHRLAPDGPPSELRRVLDQLSAITRSGEALLRSKDAPRHYEEAQRR